MNRFVVGYMTIFLPLYVAKYCSWFIPSPANLPDHWQCPAHSGRWWFQEEGFFQFRNPLVGVPAEDFGDGFQPYPIAGGQGFARSSVL